MPVDGKWHKKQIEQYKIELPHYEIYAVDL